MEYQGWSKLQTSRSICFSFLRFVVTVSIVWTFVQLGIEPDIPSHGRLRRTAGRAWSPIPHGLFVFGGSLVSLDFLTHWWILHYILVFSCTVLQLSCCLPFYLVQRQWSACINICSTRISTDCGFAHSIQVVSYAGVFRKTCSSPWRHCTHQMYKCYIGSRPVPMQPFGWWSERCLFYVSAVVCIIYAAILQPFTRHGFLHFLLPCSIFL